jgi:phosphoserine phosphatase RsbU/P
MSLKPTEDYSLRKTHLFELYVRNLGANLLGFLIIILLNFFTPLQFFKIQRAFVLEGGWMIILAFYPLVIGLGAFLQYLVQRPIAAVLSRMRRKEEIQAELRQKAQRRLMNLPLTIGLVNFAMWLGVTTMLAIIFFIFRKAPIRISLFVGFRGFMVGYIAAILSILLVEVFARRRLVPILFPRGKLASIPGTIKISIHRRIRVLYGVGTLAPMLILIGTLSFSLWEMKGNPISGEQFGREFLVFSLILFIIFVIIGLRLNILAGASIIEPIKAMMVQVRKVRKGHFKRRVRVVGNDELGELGDGINEMTEGLSERERMRRSLNLAREVQQALLPQRDPAVEGLDIASTSVYCDETGGDYYDFLTDDQKGRGKISVVVGDVAGHGVPSALLMASARAFLRQRASLPGSISAVVTDVNRQLAHDVKESGGFITLFFLRIDASAGSLNWVRAGHDPAVLYNPETGVFENLRGEGMALGVAADTRYTEYRKSNLKKGQIILLGTDGLWEARNSEGAMFGKDYIYDIVRRRSAASAKEILNTCFDSFNRFLGTRAPEDDVTLVVIKITGDGQ